jgi:SAM-dependent methyltransferase
MQDVWADYARRWSKLRPPQRPSGSDGDCMLALADPVLAGRRGDAVVVVLGVTPELVGLPWPQTALVHAFDNSRPMVEAVFKANPRIESRAHLRAWQNLPLPDRSVDLIVGDGAFNCLPEPSDYNLLLGEVARLLRPGGALIQRFYIRPDRLEEESRIVEDALAGRIGSVHVLRWRIAMALRADGMTVAVAAVRDAFDRLFPDRLRLARRTGWPADEIDMIDAYSGAPTRYTFPTRSELADLFAPRFVADAERQGDYELAERCPTIRFLPAGATAP